MGALGKQVMLCGGKKQCAFGNDEFCAHTHPPLGNQEVRRKIKVVTLP